MKKAGEDLADTAIRHNPALQGLLGATNRIYGGWYNALTENGVNPDRYRRQAANGFWTNDRIIATIREMFDRKEDISARHVSRKHSDLFHAASKSFSGYEDAVRSAGIDYDSIRKQHKEYTRDELRNFLIALRKQGIQLHLSSVREVNPTLINIIIKRFGSYKEAIEDLGLDYNSIRKDYLQQSFMGKVFEKYLGNALYVLGWDVQCQENIRIGGDRLRPDFINLRTGAWIDAKLSSYSGGTAETVRKYQKHKKKVEIIYLNGNERVWHDGSVDFVPVSDLYPALREVGAEDLVRDFEKLRKGIVRPELQQELDKYQTSKKRP
jgi:hypothetical protein